jgi:hypothetical protein
VADLGWLNPRLLGYRAGLYGVREMTTKHTPAPWQIDGGTFVYALGPGGTNKFFTSVQAAGPERIGELEKEANARLIAASPMMYDFIAMLAANGNTKAALIIEAIHA